LGLIAAASAFGQSLAKRRALIRFARAASADSGLVADPVADLNSSNPLKVKVDAMISGADFEPVGLSEQAVLDEELGQQSEC
jgi:hypothetical protein